MELKFSKNYIGTFATLLLIILLCQTTIFNFFIDTYFGRFIFVLSPYGPRREDGVTVSRVWSV
jgi:hypothetical protein